MKAEGLAQVVVLDETRHAGVHGAVGAQPRQVRRDTQHVREAQEGRRRQLLVTLLEHSPRILDEALVTLGVARAALADLGVHLRAVAAVVELVAIRPREAVERVHRQQLDVVAQLAAGHLEQLLQAMWCGDHGGAPVETKPVALVHVGAPTGLVPRLVQHHVGPGRLQPDRRGEPPKAAADDGGARGPGGALVRLRHNFSPNARVRCAARPGRARAPCAPPGARSWPAGGSAPARGPSPAGARATVAPAPPRPGCAPRPPDPAPPVRRTVAREDRRPTRPRATWAAPARGPRGPCDSGVR